MKFNTVKSKVVLFLSILTMLGTFFCIVSCDNFLSQNYGKTTINIKLDLSKIIKTARNENSQNNTEFVLKLFVYDATNYKNDGKVEELPLVTQTSNKVDINGTVKASLEVAIDTTVIFVGKLFTLNENNVESDKPLYAGKSEVFKVQPKDNKVHLVLTETHEHTFATEWTTNATHHWKEATCEHSSEVTDFGEHSFGEYVSNNDATTEAEGTKTRECSVCKYEDTVTDEGSKIKVPETVFVKGGTIAGALPAWVPEYASDGDKGVFVEGRTVILSDFYMGKYEVTQEEYASVMTGQKVTVYGIEYELESNPNYCTEDSTKYTLFEGETQGKRPVEGVTWYDAVWYCNALSEKEGLTPAYSIEVTEVKQASEKTGYYIYGATVTLNANATGYRLPTEAEWEYTARGGDQTQPDWNYTFSGADKASGAGYGDSKNSGLDSVGWYCYNNITGITGDIQVTTNVSGKGTHEVGKKAPNRLGLYDMSGNVHEWCYDWYGTVKTGTETDPTGTSGSGRVGRGSAWDGDANGASLSSRSGINPYSRGSGQGFRVVRSANTTD